MAQEGSGWRVDAMRKESKRKRRGKSSSFVIVSFLGIFCLFSGG